MNNNVDHRSSNSSNSGLGILAKLSENVRLLNMRINGKRGIDRFSELFEELAGYDCILQCRSNKKLSEARCLEIGYGARPNRLLALIGLGIDAEGVDLDRPMLSVDFSSVVDIYKKNGFERAVKSTVRGLLFDRGERADLEAAIRERGGELIVDSNRFHVGNSSEISLGNSRYDLIYSEDVFEHIPQDDLRKVIENMRQWLRPGGIALVRPCVHTGITGGHLTEWYPHTLELPLQRKSAPWEHLRQRRFPADCYLNGLRLQDYRDLFSEHFDMLEERSDTQTLGREFLTDEIRSELSGYTDEELMSNQVLFVLRPKVT